MWLLDLFDKEKREERRKKCIEQYAETLFDVTFSEEQLWLCYNGQKIAPMSLLTEKTDVSECTALVSVIRKLYIKRNL